MLESLFHLNQISLLEVVQCLEEILVSWWKVWLNNGLGRISKSSSYSLGSFLMLPADSIIFSWCSLACILNNSLQFCIRCHVQLHEEDHNSAGPPNREFQLCYRSIIVLRTWDSFTTSNNSENSLKKLFLFMTALWHGFFTDIFLNSRETSPDFFALYWLKWFNVIEIATSNLVVNSR